ncbi:hypothetical protein GPECTOR_22g849 [Gonium pectorale]|uniref:Uncharacterized protein n=1 Tax=Gonium pectorale TaxID=33097 RepID=A0A150GHF1_GONPE|nr:hypothetical protein GPECTOR_22g849 [Gonium pectorale]|eukprot:KXZ49256.1 hypothetical protein GPECTOR_22g849 [Gonium pectorale]
MASSASPSERADRKARLVAEHEEVYHNVCSNIYGTGSGSIFATSCSANVKPAADFPTPTPLERCTPIGIAELRPGVTHRGRVLRGKLIVLPVVMTGMMSLLEDEHGDVVMVALYNCLPPNCAGLPGMRVAAREFPRGQAVAIIEPFLKTMSDGRLGVRVDNPREAIKLDSLQHSDAAALQAQGRQHFTAAQYEQAADCYRRALGRIPDAGGGGSELLVAVLLNAAIAHHRRGDSARSLLAASAAVSIRPESSKAHYRCAAALAKLGAPLAARVALNASFECMPGGGPTSDEWRRMTAELGALPGAADPPTPKEAAAGRDEALRLLASAHALDGAAVAAVASAAGDADTSASAAAAVAAATAAKEAGNVAFGKGNWDEALERYRQACATLVSALPAATLLANLAACGLQRAQPREALAAATAAAVLQPGNAALALGWTREGAVAVAIGLASVGTDGEGADALRALQERIVTAERVAGKAAGKAAAGRPPGSAGRGGNTESSGGGRGGDSFRHVSERELEGLKGPVAAVESTAMLNMMTQMLKLRPSLKTEEPLMWAAMQSDERVPPFHQEFSKAGRWPPLCDVEQCGRRLWDSYELCVGMARHLLSMSMLDGCDPVEVLLRRVGSLDVSGAQRMQWLASDSTPDGAVSFRAFHGAGYNPTIVHSFSNTATPALPMPPPAPAEGAGPADPWVHVAVGFVDLGTLAAAVNRPEWDAHVEAAAGDGPGAAGPLLMRWMGFEASPCCVAKTLVLERMMRDDGQAATEHVLQVWYSSVWTRAAAAAFRAALTALLREAGPSLTPEVAAYLRHWQLKDCDRMALIEYLITGQLPGLGPAGELVGSVVMFASPKGGPKHALDESFLETLPQDELFAARLASGNEAGDSRPGASRRGSMGSAGSAGGSESSQQVDIVSAGVGILRRRVQRMAALVASGRVEVQVALRCVQPGDSAAAAAISALRPDSISWSNLPDYYPPEEFHKMARACSKRPGASTRAATAAATAGGGHNDAAGRGVGGAGGGGAGAAVCGTVHHMHTMNWCYDVKGSCHLDFLLPYLSTEGGPEARRRPGGGAGARPAVPKELGKRILSLLEAGQRAVKQDLSRHGGHGAALLWEPPVDTPRNVVDFLLIVQHYKAWVDAFFAAGGLGAGRKGCMAEVTAPPTYAPLGRSNTTVCLAFAYGDIAWR